MVEDPIQRGIQAQSLLDNEFFRGCLNDLDGQYHAAWREARTLEAREDCFRYVKCIEKILTDLQSIATTGKLNEQRLNELEGSKKRIFAAWPTR